MRILPAIGSLLTAGLVGCIGLPPEVDDVTSAHTPHFRPGEEAQGIALRGDVAGVDRVSMHGAYLNGKALTSVSLIKGELVGTRVINLPWPQPDVTQTFRGTAMKGAYLKAYRGGTVVDLRIDNVTANPLHPVTELPYDSSGGTFFYNFSYIKTYGLPPDSQDVYAKFCDPNLLGHGIGQDPTHEHDSYEAIVSPGIWDSRANHLTSSTSFTISCMSGAIAKCGGYGTGYLPWKPTYSGSEPMWDMIQACTRMVRADYCGKGESNTYTGTFFNGYDTLWPHVMSDDNAADDGTLHTMKFESAWRPDGAVCLSKARWDNLPPPEGLCGDDTHGPFTMVDHDPAPFEFVPNICNDAAAATNPNAPWANRGPINLLTESYIRTYPNPIIVVTPGGSIATQ